MPILRRAVSLPLTPSAGQSHSRLSLSNAHLSLLSLPLSSRVRPFLSLLNDFLSFSLSRVRPHRFLVSLPLSDYLASSSSPLRIVRTVRRSGTWFNRCAMYRRPVYLPLSRDASPPPARSPPTLRTVLVRSAARHRDYRASILFSLPPSTARAGYPIILDSRRSGSAQPLLSLRRALEYRHATDGGGHETRELCATATRSVRKVTRR